MAFATANAANGGPLLSATGLCKSYGHGDALVHAVADVDIELREGELIAIMGASGSGKTTLLHLLAGLTRSDNGEIRLGNLDYSKLSDSELTALRCQQISVIFQAYNLLPTLTALDNVALPMLLAGVGRGKARAVAREKLALVGLTELATRRPPQLSGGEQQRVAVARALATEPSIVLADEPTGNLDRKNAESICELLRQVGASQGRAVALVTHDPFVAAYADRVIVLVDGRHVAGFDRKEVGTAEDLALRYMQAASRA